MPALFFALALWNAGIGGPSRGQKQATCFCVWERWLAVGRPRGDWSSLANTRSPRRMPLDACRRSSASSGLGSSRGTRQGPGCVAGQVLMLMLLLLVAHLGSVHGLCRLRARARARGDTSRRLWSPGDLLCPTPTEIRGRSISPAARAVLLPPLQGC